MTSNKLIEVVTLKSIGDASLEKGKLTRSTTLLAYAIGFYKDALGRCEDIEEQEVLLHRIGYAKKIMEQISTRKAKNVHVSPVTTGIQKAKTKLSTVAEDFREFDLIFKSRSNLDAVERGYSRKLVHAISKEDEVLECEALKSLGDLYLHKAKTNRNKTVSFNKACALYEAASRYCTSNEEKQVIEHRIKYAEKCTKLQLVHCQSHTKADFRSSANTVLTVSLELHRLKEETKLKGYGVTPLIEAYTKSFVAAVVRRNKLLEIESMKIIADLYLERGRVGKDGAEVDKAAGLYRAALGRCKDPDGTETLKHRIKYAEDVKEQVKRRQGMGLPKNKKIADTFKSSPTSSQTARGMWITPGSTALVDSSDKRRENTDSTYQEHLQEGCRALQKADLDNAEQAFADALKCVHVKDSNTGQYRKEAEPLYKLGHVYLKRGMESKDGYDFTKAAALCNAALVRASKEDKSRIKQTILKITQSFLKYMLSTSVEQTADIDDVEKHKSMLNQHREFVEEEIKRIEQEVDPYSLDDDDPKLREVEEMRAEEIKTLFQSIVHQRKTFIAGLVDECTEIMGPPPCKYAMIGLGSQATGLVTPYSDLEFAILVEDETEGNVRYFRNLTHYLHLKVINLGETIIPAMGIKSLNNFHSDDPLDNWFYDSVTPRGFAFDGAMPHASKTPLGRGKSCELIHTPSNMTNILKDDLMLHLKKGYHLASILGNVSLITGEQELVDVYSTLWTERLQGNHITSIVQAFVILNEETNAQTFKSQTVNSSLLNVKKEIYRFSTLALSCWALLCGIQPTTIWETIQNMYMNGVVSSENAHHLKVLVSISAELRLRTYMNNRGQVENMSALSSVSTDVDIRENVKMVFYISNSKQIMRYYYTARPLKSLISQLNEANPPTEEPLILYDNSPRLQAEVYKSLCDYEKSKTYAERALQNDQSRYGERTAHLDIAESLGNLGGILGDLGDHKRAASYYEQSLQMMRSIYGDHTPHPGIASLLNGLGNAWTHLGDYRNAISYNEQSLQMMKRIHGETTKHPDIARSLANLGNAKEGLGDYREAVSYYEQSLQMIRSIFGETTAHPNIAGTLLNLGAAWNHLADYRKAISYYKQSLQMARDLYGEATAHPEIALSLDHLGNAWRDLGDYRKATAYYEQSIQIMWSIYGRTTAHPLIAKALVNLGTVWNDRGDHKKAITYYEQSLHMMNSIYGERKEQPEIGKLLQNLGATWKCLGDNRKAISYLEQSLQMMRRIYGEDFAHPDIAAALHNLGEVWNDLGDHRKAVGFNDKALQMRRRIYGESNAHPGISMSLHALGGTWLELGDYRKALTFLELSIQMLRTIHGEYIAHPHVTVSLNNLGIAWGKLGDHRKAISYFEQSLSMRQLLYGENTQHPDIAQSLSNLGGSWSALGFSHLERALHMERRIFGNNIAHSLQNLGFTWEMLGFYKKALSYYEQTLQMKRSIYGTAHPEVKRLTETVDNLRSCMP
ncbi:uncharacterized protein LOC144878940 [Branchiostoma floridae x Branchiostoma japonicum]